MTGLKNFDEGHISLNILIEKLKNLKGVYFTNIDESLLNNENEFKCSFCDKIVSKHNIKHTLCNHTYKPSRIKGYYPPKAKFM